MSQKSVQKDVVIFLFIILALGSIAFLSLSATLSVEEARMIFSSRRIVAWIITTGAASMIVFGLLRLRRQAVERRQTLETFLNSAGDGIIAVDRGFTIRLWNLAAEVITGYTASEVVGKSFRDVMTFYRERDRSEDIVFIEETMLYGDRRSILENMYLVRKNGSEVPVGDSASPIMDGYGSVTGAIIVFRDATVERKQQSLRSEFAYASHQLRTPVTKALWSIEAALDEEVPDKRSLQMALSSLKSIRRMSSEIVDISELDQGIVRVKKVAVPLVRAVEDVRSSFAEQISERNIQFDVDDVGEDMIVEADPKLLHRVLIEVISNGYQYNKAVGSLRVRARRDGGMIIVEVADEGIGISSDEQATVFSKFFRGENVDTTHSPGAGLGLYIARGYVELMGGKMWFSSTEGKGSVFSFSLPAVARRPGPNPGDIVKKK